MFKANGRVNKSYANKDKVVRTERTFVCKSCGACRESEVEFGEVVVCQACGSLMIEKKLEK